MKILFVVNPISGGVDKKDFITEATETCLFYNISFSVFYTTGKKDKQKLKAVLKKFKPDKVASVGGDGTILFTATALMDTPYPMGIIPLGSANGMATELSINPAPIEALKDIIMSAMIRGLDLLKINKKYYTMHIGDVGINANIVKSYSKDPNRGMMTYAKYFFEEIKSLKNFTVTVKTPNSEYSSEVYMAAICNSRKYGSGVPLDLSGNPMDGKFEIVLLEQIDIPSIISAGLAAFNEKFYTNQQRKVITTDKAELLFSKPRLLQLDGEVIKKYKKISVEILPGAVQLITTKANKNILN